MLLFWVNIVRGAVPRLLAIGFPSFSSALLGSVLSSLYESAHNTASRPKKNRLEEVSRVFVLW
jgi:hypothetical protein